MENNEVVLFHANEIKLEDHLSKIGLPSSSKIVYQDPESGMIVKLVHYPKGTVARQHTHHCGHGMYVLKGTLYTDRGNFEPGSFVWFKEGVVMEHGARDTDVDCVFITNKAFDIDYLELHK